MTLTLFITDNCQACKRVQNQITHLFKDNLKIKLQIENIRDYSKNNLLIVPALYIEDELYSYGDIDENKLLNKINSTN